MTITTVGKLDVERALKAIAAIVGEREGVKIEVVRVRPRTEAEKLDK